MLLLLLNSPPPVVFVLSLRVALLSTQYGQSILAIQDPDEILDFDIDWAQRLFSEEELALFNAGRDVDPDDAIATSVFSLPAGGPVAISSRFSGTATKVWLSGGAEISDLSDPKPHHHGRRSHHGPDRQAQVQKQVSAMQKTASHNNWREFGLVRI